MNLKKIFTNLVYFFRASKILNNFPDAVVFVDSDGFISQINKKAGELFLINEGQRTLLFDDLIKNGMELVKFSSKSKRPLMAEANVSGHCFSVELMASKKKNIFLVSIRTFTKMTEDAENNNKVEKINTEKNAMLVKITPEIKSYIDSITGFSKGLLDGLGGNLTEKQAKYIKIINTNATNLDLYIDKLTEFSYCESSLYSPEYKKFDSVAIAKDVIKEIEQDSIGKQVEILFNYDALGNRQIYNDEKAFKKIIKNILTASIYMVENGSITLQYAPVNEEASIGFGLDEEKKYLQIILQDTGCGFEPAEIKNLCDPYYSAYKDKKSFLRALMLGSASILVKRSGGFIDITSELVRGTIYNIVIPMEKGKNE